jgi:hypothetical protein
MIRKLVTCPNTAHLEEIAYLDHPLGVLITSCSASPAGCALRCERTCAALMDRRKRLERRTADPKIGTILLVRSCLRE